MNYTIHRQKDVLVVELSGTTWGTLQDVQLKSEISTAISMGWRRFLLDFANVGVVTSMGLGVVVASWASICQAQGSLILCGINPRIQTVMDVAGVSGILDLRADRAGALAAFGSS